MEQIILLGLVFVIGTFAILIKTRGFLVEKLLVLIGVLGLVLVAGCG